MSTSRARSRPHIQRESRVHYPAELSTAVAGVQFSFDRRGREKRGLVLAEALQCSFGADSDPESWLAAFDKYHRRIVTAAIRRYRSRPDHIIVLRSTDF
jgi:hypothetical protein